MREVLRERSSRARGDARCRAPAIARARPAPAQAARARAAGVAATRRARARRAIGRARSSVSGAARARRTRAPAAARAARRDGRAGASRGRGAASRVASACAPARARRAASLRSCVGEALAVGHDERRRGGGRRRAHVGDEVADREVGLVPDAATRRAARDSNTARATRLLVERPQVLDRPAAAARRSARRPRRARWRCGSPARSSAGGVRPAPAVGIDHDRASAGQRRRNVVSTSRSAAPRGDVTMPTARGNARQRALALGGEPACGLEPRLEPREALVQRAHARQAQRVDVELELAARLVDRRQWRAPRRARPSRSANVDVLRLLRRYITHLHLRLRVLEREVEVPRRRAMEQFEISPPTQASAEVALERCSACGRHETRHR